MIMKDEQVIDIIEKEFKSKTLGLTEQYLKIHSPIYIDQKLKVDRIDRETGNELITAYLPVLDEKFYIAVIIDTKTSKVIGFYSEAYQRVYFRAISKQLSEDQLRSMTKLKPTESWNMGDPRKDSKSNYNFSSFIILPNPEPDEFGDKLKKLLDLLEQDKDGIKRLVDKANGYIQVAMTIHNANGMIGGPTINKECIQKMNDLRLEINFDLYVEGKMFKRTY